LETGKAFSDFWNNFSRFREHGKRFVLCVQTKWMQKKTAKSVNVAAMLTVPAEGLKNPSKSITSLL